MSRHGPATDAEQRGWQLRSARALVDLLAAAHDADLPPLVWEVGVTGGLFGRCLELKPAERLAEFEAWAAFLDGQRPAGQTWGGKTRLRVLRSGWAPGVDVAMLADIYDEAVGCDCDGED